MSLERIVGTPQSTGYIIVIMELNWYFTGAVGMKQQSCWGVLWFFKRLQVSPLEKQRNWQHDTWCLTTNIWANRAAIVSSIITRYVTLTKIGQSPFNLQICLCSVEQFSHIRCQFFCYCYQYIRFSVDAFCSVLYDLLLFNHSVFNDSFIQCYFLIWYWNCISGILIPKITNINHLASQQTSYTRLCHLLS